VLPHTLFGASLFTGEFCETIIPEGREIIIILTQMFRIFITSENDLFLGGGTEQELVLALDLGAHFFFVFGGSPTIKSFHTHQLTTKKWRPSRRILRKGGNSRDAIHDGFVERQDT